MCELWSASSSDISSFGILLGKHLNVNLSLVLLYADNSAESLQHWTAYWSQPSLISVCWWQRLRCVWISDASLPIRADLDSPLPLAPVNWGLINRNLQHMCHLVHLGICTLYLWSYFVCYRGFLFHMMRCSFNNSDFFFVNSRLLIQNNHINSLKWLFIWPSSPSRAVQIKYLLTLVQQKKADT